MTSLESAKRRATRLSFQAHLYPYVVVIGTAVMAVFPCLYVAFGNVESSTRRMERPLFRSNEPLGMRDSESAMVVVSLLLVVCVAIAVLVGIRLARGKVLEYRALLDSNPEFSAIDPNDAPELYTKGKELMTAAGLDASRLRLVAELPVSTTNAVAVSGKDEDRIVVSMGFLRLWCTDLPVAQAILAHEVGHIRNRDSQGWVMLSPFASSVTPGLVIALGMTLLLLFAVNPVFAAFWSIGAVGLTILCGALYLRKSRALAEAAADCVAVGLVGQEPVLKALELASSECHVNDERWSLVATPKGRAEYIRDWSPDPVPA